MRIGHKLAAFAAEVGQGCSRPLYKFIRDMLTGMVAKKSILLSDVGRALNEKTDLLYTEKRLSRNLTHGDMDDDSVRQNYLRTVGRDTKNAIIAFDLSEVRKEYSKDQPYLAGIYDSSLKEKAIGYWLTMVEAVRPDGKHAPLWLKAWSQKTPGFVSQNDEISQTIRTVSAHTERSATWVFDRGFDGPKVMEACESCGVTYVIRQVGKRSIFDDGIKRQTHVVAANVAMPYRFAWRFIRHSKRYPSEYRCGSTIVALQDGVRRQLLVMQNVGYREPMMLLSNSLDTSRANVIHLCMAYLRRWRIEEATRAIKQCFELENLRPLTWTGIQRIVLFAFLAWAFLCKVAKTLRSKASKLFTLHKSFGATPDFFYYRLAESLALLLLLPSLSP